MLAAEADVEYDDSDGFGKDALPKQELAVCQAQSMTGAAATATATVDVVTSPVIAVSFAERTQGKRLLADCSINGDDENTQEYRQQIKGCVGGTLASNYQRWN